MAAAGVGVVVAMSAGFVAAAAVQAYDLHVLAERGVVVRADIITEHPGRPSRLEVEFRLQDANWRFGYWAGAADRRRGGVRGVRGVHMAGPGAGLAPPGPLNAAAPPGPGRETAAPRRAT